MLLRVIACAPLPFLLVAGAFPPALAATSARPPDNLVAALAARRCPSPEWHALPGEVFLARCNNDGAGRSGGRVVRLFAFARAKDGERSWRLQRFVDWEESLPEAREKVAWEVKVFDARVVVIARKPFGQQLTRTWDLSSLPARLVAEVEGGNRPCREAQSHDGRSYANLDMSEALCTTDHEKKRQSCVRDHPDCKRDPSQFRKARYTAIPMHLVGNKQRDKDLFACATTIGAEKDDLIRGTNPKKTTFTVVGVQDGQTELIRLHVRLDDKTASWAASAEDDWQAKDHFELWLGSDRDDVQCGGQGELRLFCQELLLRWKLSMIVIAPLKDRKGFLIFPSSAKPGPSRSDSLTARWEDKTLVLEFRGPAYQSLHHGAATLIYSDSLDGKKQDTLIGTSPLQSGVAETPGRIGDFALCDEPRRAPGDDTGEVVSVR